MSATSTGTSSPAKAVDKVLVGVPEHEDAGGVIAKYYVLQIAVLKNSKRMFHITPSKFYITEVGAKASVKLEGNFDDILNITPVKESKGERLDFVMEVRYKNKRVKETFSTPHREHLLTTIHRLSAAQSGRDRRFYLKKWAKNNQTIDYCLSVFGASFARLDMNTQKPLKIWNLSEIREILTIKEKPGFVIFLYKGNFRMHCFVCEEAKVLIDCVNDTLRQKLCMDVIQVKEVEEASLLKVRDSASLLKADALISSHAVEKVKKEVGQDLTTASRLLCLYTKNIVEQDSSSNAVHTVHDLSDILSIIRYYHNDRLFGIEFKNDRLYKYLSDDRDVVILNILELARRHEVSIAINPDEVVEGVREGKRQAVPHNDYSELALKKLSSLEKDSFEEAMKNIREFNMSYALGVITPSLAKDKAPLKSALALLSKVEKQNIREIDLYHIYTFVHRLLFSKACYEEIANFKPNFMKIAEDAMNHKFDSVRSLASRILLESISEHSKEKVEILNQNIILCFENIQSFVKFIEKDHKNPKQIIVISNLLDCFGQALESLLVPEICDKLVAVLYEARATLYQLCRSKALTAGIAATQLLVTLYSRLTPEKAAIIQKEVLGNGILIFAIYQALFSTCPMSRELNMHFVDLSVSYCRESALLLERIIPEPFLAHKNESSQRTVIQHKEPKKSMFSKTKAKATKVEVKTQNWDAVLKCLFSDYEDPLVIWNEATRQDLKQAIEFQLKCIDNAVAQYKERDLIWNYEEFTVDFKSIAHEVKAGIFFVRLLGIQEKLQNLKIKDPLSLLKELYYRLLLETEDSVRIMFAKALHNVYVSFLAEKGVQFPHLDHLVNAIQKENYSRELLLELLLLISSAMSVWVNTHQMTPQIIPLVLPFLKEIHIAAQQPSSVPADQIAAICLNILMRLTNIRTDKLKENQILRPIPKAIEHLCQPSNLPIVIQSLLHKSERVLQVSYALILHILRVNDLITPLVYKTGLFYFLLSNIEHEELKPEARPVFTPEAACLLKFLHNQQKFNPEEFNLNQEDITEFKGSILHVFLPEPLIAELEEKDEVKFTEIFNGEFNTPKLVWNREMRLHLQKSIRKHLESFMQKISQDADTVYEFAPIAPVVYEQTYNLIYVARHYLTNLIDKRYEQFVIADPVDLLDKILVAFAKEKQEDRTLVMVKSIILLLDRINPSKWKRFPAFDTLLKAVAIGSTTQWNVELCEQVVRACFMLLRTEENREEFVKQKGQEVFLTLLNTALQRFSGVTFEVIEDGETQFAHALFRGLIEVLAVASQMNDVQISISLDANFVKIAMSIITRMRSAALLKSTCKLLTVLSQNSSIVRKFWNAGLPLFFLRLFLSDQVDKSDQELMCKILTLFIVNNLKTQEESNKYVVHDLNNILPTKFVDRLSAEHTALLNMLQTEVTVPDLIWNKDAKYQLQQYLDTKCEALQKKDFEDGELVYEPIKYNVTASEMQIGGIFLRIYNLPEHASWRLKDGVGFLSELLKFLALAETQDTISLEIVLEAVINVLERTTEFKNLVSTCFTNKNIIALFRCLRLDSSKISFIAYASVLRIIIKCIENNNFMDRLIANEVLHNLTFSLKYAASAIDDRDQVVFDVVYALLEKLMTSIKLSTDSMTNGIFLYVLGVMIGIYRCKEVFRAKSASLIGIMNRTVQERLPENTLRRVLPKNIVDTVLNKPLDTVAFFEDLHNKPDLKWNEGMRKELRAFVQQEISDFESKLLVSEAPQWKLAEGFKLKYAETKDDLQVCDVFVELYNRDPKFKLKEPLEFVVGLFKILEGETNVESQHQIIEAINNATASNPALATNPVFSNYIGVLLKLLSNDESHFLLVLDILYKVFPCNRDVSGRIENEELALKLFDKLGTVEIAEPVLLVLLSWTRANPDIGKQLLDAKKDELLIEMMNNSSPQLKAKAAYVLQVLSLVSEDLKRTLEATSFWEEYSQLTQPENPPLNINKNSASPLERVASSSSVTTTASPAKLPPTPTLQKAPSASSSSTPAPPSPQQPPSVLPPPPVVSNPAPQPEPVVAQAPATPPPVVAPPSPTVDIPLQAPTFAAPPPPPPAPPAMPAAPPVSPPTGDRSNLLSSIRAGTMLRKVPESEKRIAETDPKKMLSGNSSSSSSSSAPANPLMAAIAAAAAKRQQEE